VSSTWWARIQKIRATVNNPVPVRLDPVAMLMESSAVEPSPLCPDPGRATRKEKEDAARTPLSVPLLPARRRPSWPRQRRPTVPRRRDQTPLARAQSRSARLCPCTSPEHPAPATYWTSLPPLSWPIKTPSEHTSELTPFPVSSQTPFFPPVRSRST
jgi:hypothetical protein